MKKANVTITVSDPLKEEFPERITLIEQNRKLKERIREMSANYEDKHYVESLERSYSESIIENKSLEYINRVLRDRIKILESVIKCTVGRLVDLEEKEI